MTLQGDDIAPDFAAETQGHALNFPLIADPGREIANLYGTIHPNASGPLTVRSVLVIGPDETLKLTLTYPASTGRSFAEILRAIDSLQLTARYSVATPVNREDGVNGARIVPKSGGVKFLTSLGKRSDWRRVADRPGLAECDHHRSPSTRRGDGGLPTADAAPAAAGSEASRHVHLGNFQTPLLGRMQAAMTDGEDVIILPSLSDAQAREKLPGGWKPLKPDLRVVPQPGRDGAG